MEEIPVGIYITGIHRDVTLAEVKQTIFKFIGSAPSLYRNGSPSITELVTEKMATKNIVVSGILVPYGEIVKKLARKKIRDNIIIIHDVDFGLQRGNDGHLTSQQMLFHEQLKTAAGFGTTINFLHPEFLRNQLGHMEVLSPELTLQMVDDKCLYPFLNGPEGLVRWRRIMSPGRKRKFGENAGFHGAAGNDLVALTFTSALHALQFILMHNKGEELNGAAFVHLRLRNQKDPEGNGHGSVCQLRRNRGLGINGTFLNIDEVVRDKGCVPFNLIDSSLVNWKKLEGLRARCIYCHSYFRLEGISPHAYPLCADCDCFDKRKSFWLNTKLAKLGVKRSIEEMTIKFGNVDRMTDEGIYPVLPGMRVLFDDLGQFIDSVVACTDYDYSFLNNQMFEHWARGLIIDTKIIYDQTVITGQTTDYRMCVRVKRNELWSVDGSFGIGRITVVLFPKLGKDGDLGRKLTKGEMRFSSKIYDVWENGDRCFLILRISVPSVQLEELGEEVKKVALVPHPSMNDKVGLNRAVAHRNVFETQEKSQWPLFHADQIELDFLQKLDWDFPLYIRDLHIAKIQIDYRLTEWLGLLLPYSYIGFNCKLDGILNLREKQSREPLRATGRVIGTEGTKLLALIILPANIDSSNVSASLEFWVLNPYPLWKLFHLAGLEYENRKSQRALSGFEEDQPVEIAEIFDNDLDSPSTIPIISEEEEELFSDFKGMDAMGENETDLEKEKLDDVNLDPSVSSTGKLVYYRWDNDGIDIEDLINTSHLQTVLNCWQERPHVDASGMNMFFHSSPTFPFPKLPKNEIKKDDDQLNSKLPDLLADRTEQQVGAILNGQRHFFNAVIGQPGSGKSRTMIREVLYRFCTREGLIVVTSTSNFACDVLMDMLREESKRFGIDARPLRMWSKGREKLFLKSGTSSADDFHMAVRNHELWNSNPQVNEILKKLEEEGEGSLTDYEQGMLDAHIRLVEGHVFRMTGIIVATCATALDNRLSSQQQSGSKNPLPISSIFVDEASRAEISVCFSLMQLRSSHFAIYGDPNQLNKVPVCYATEKANSNISWLQLLTTHPIVKEAGLFNSLCVQFRMAVPICELVSDFAYGGKLISHDSVRQRDYGPNGPFSHLFPEFPEMATHNVFLHDYRTTNKELQQGMHNSYVNQTEVGIVCDLLKRLKTAGMDMAQVGVLSLYKNQSIEMEKAINAQGPEFKAVFKASSDSMQGKELSVCILSLVRSNAQHNVGYIRDLKHLTVALSRAIDYEFIVCDSTVFESCGIPNIKRLFRNLSDSTKAFRKTIKI